MGIFSKFTKLPLKPKLIIILVIAAAGWFAYSKFSQSQNSQPQYQTSVAETGVLVEAISASGQVSAANNASVSTQASGVVKKVFVQNGQAVKAGDKIAELELDLDGKYRSTQAWSSYQSAKNNFESAKATLLSLNSSMWSANQKFINDAVARNLTVDNPAYIMQSSDWLSAEAKYQIQQAAVSQAQNSASSAWLNYQQSSPIVYSPISGTVTGLSLQPGTVLTAQSSTSGSATSQKIASVKTNAPAQIQVNITEMDISKIKIGAKATLTLDAFVDKTYTGKVISVDTIGSVNSGVTSYPAVIGLDTEDPQILPNMAATANIIVNVYPESVLVPSSAVITSNGETVVRLLKNNKVELSPVEVLGTGDSQTAISSGVSAGDVVVTSVITSTNSTRSSQGSTSVFGGMSGGRGFVISR
ncbi:hypothetical protein A2397_04635 [Candidatus Amesbacteria bacterium RIFOXYB1_FULL_44_23]|uniref:Uncharacterized protein n=1 Tax=Candidatus Amesbacteria bacterium RIFOXYB1_FULL_44_23 TaxID=1797263 RepID=A0A1F4ZXF9_9BACT|nr:MAG: hypothetical protein A2397_04635 [Candidatus Amesbacteria bacterium RIFOXYB1_FULL_44_23]